MPGASAVEGTCSQLRGTPRTRRPRWLSKQAGAAVVVVAAVARLQGVCGTVEQAGAAAAAAAAAPSWAGGATHQKRRKGIAPGAGAGAVGGRGTGGAAGKGSGAGNTAGAVEARAEAQAQREGRVAAVTGAIEAGTGRGVGPGSAAGRGAVAAAAPVEAYGRAGTVARSCLLLSHRPQTRRAQVLGSGGRRASTSLARCSGECKGWPHVTPEAWKRGSRASGRARERGVTRPRLGQHGRGGKPVGPPRSNPHMESGLHCSTRNTTGRRRSCRCRGQLLGVWRALGDRKGPPERA